MTKKTPSGVRKHHKSTKPELTKTIFFFFLSYFFRRDGSILHEPLTVVYTWNNSILYGAMHNPITFTQLWSLGKDLQPLTQKLWLPVWDTTCC